MLVPIEPPPHPFSPRRRRVVVALACFTAFGLGKCSRVTPTVREQHAFEQSCLPALDRGCTPGGVRP